MVLLFIFDNIFNDKNKKFKFLLLEINLIIIYWILFVFKVIYLIVYLKCYMDLIVLVEIDKIFEFFFLMVIIKLLVCEINYWGEVSCNMI